MPPQYTIKQIADFMRSKYPELKDQADDNGLARFALKKHPQFAGKVMLPPPMPVIEAPGPNIGERIVGAGTEFAKGAADFLDPAMAAQLLNPENLMGSNIPPPPLGLGVGMDVRPIEMAIRGIAGQIEGEREASVRGLKQAINPPSSVFTREGVADVAEGLGDYIAHSFGTLPLVGPIVSIPYETAKTAPWRAFGQLLLGVVAPELLQKYVSKFPKAPKQSLAQREQAVIKQMSDGLLDDISEFKGSPEELGKFIETSLDTYVDVLTEPGKPTPKTTRGYRVFNTENNRLVDWFDNANYADAKASSNSKWDYEEVVNIEPTRPSDALSGEYLGLQSPEEALVFGLIDNALKRNPDIAYTILKSPRMSAERLVRLKEIVGPETYRAMVAQNIQDLLRKTRDAEILIPGTTDVQQVATQKKALLNQLTKTDFGVQIKKMMDPSEYNKLQEIAKLAAAYDMKTHDWLGHLEGLIRRRLTNTAFRRLVGPTLGPATSVGMQIGGEFSSRMIARLMSRPEGLTNIRELVRAMGKGDVPRLAFYTGRIGNLVERELKRNYGQGPTVPLKDRPLVMPPPPG